MTEMEFAEPPTPDTPEGRARDWDSIAERLRQNPMKWLLVQKQARLAIYNSVRQGTTKAMHPSLGFEATTRNNNYAVSPRTADLYVRYNPDKDEGLSKAAARRIKADVRRADREKEKK